MAKKSEPKAKKREPNAKFMKPMKLTPELTEVVGKGPMPRTEVTKKLWVYIKKHKLQDAENRRNINPDEKLAKVFGKKTSINMFEMTKLVNKHLS
jgi:upstream activation factor subunit UAF30